MFLAIVFNLAKSVEPDKIWHYAAFHLGLHCLPKYLFSGIPNEIVMIYTTRSWPQGYKTFFMLNSGEHEIYPAHKC